MGRAMFEYTKQILEKISFSSELFIQEVENSMKRLLPFEIQELQIWIKNLVNKKPELKPSVLLIENKKKSF